MVRFSSFGDIVQAIVVPGAFRRQYPQAHVDWLVRSDYKDLIKTHPEIDTAIVFERRQGLAGLIRLAWQLASSGRYTHIYDAHNNLRSRIALTAMRVCWLLKPRLRPESIKTRPKNRWRRFRYFQLGQRSAIQMPFRGALSFLEPLVAWGVRTETPPGAQFVVTPEASASAAQRLRERGKAFDIALVPSAAWEMKRWPVENWQQLIRDLQEFRFVILGGKEDLFCKDLEAVAPDRVLNLAGELSLQESSACLARAKLVISGDTGLLHVADQLARPTLALIGPTAFGYPSRSSSVVLETTLPCKPCSKDGRGRCKNKVYQLCMLEITPMLVAKRARELLQMPQTQDVSLLKDPTT